MFPASKSFCTPTSSRRYADDPDKAEYFVRVDWLVAVPAEKAVNEVGLFGNQNTVCQLTTPKWRHTAERLKTYFPNWDASQGLGNMARV